MRNSNPDDEMLAKLLPILLTLLLVPTAVSADEPAEPDVELTAVDEVFGPLAGVPCTPEAVPGGIECLVDDHVVFAVAHPALHPEPDDYRDRTRGMVPVGPVEIDGDYYYGVENELYRFDDRRRALVDRTRFPSSIADIEADGDELKVTIEAPVHRTGPVDPAAEDESGQTVTVDWRPDHPEAPGRAPWDWTGTLAVLHDAMWLEGVELRAEPGEDRVGVDFDPADDRRALASLERREEIDRTNPYLALYRGETHERLGEVEAATEAYRRAVDHRGADWIDRLRIGWRLELRDRPDLADEAFDRARSEMKEAGVRGEYVTAMVNAMYAFVWLAPGLTEAVDRVQLETADRLAGHVDETFPKLEGAPAAWSRLGAFFDQQGDAARADRWRDRADEIRAVDDRPDRLFEEGAAAVDLYLVLQVGLLLTAVLGGAILGLRRYEQDVDDSEDADGGGGDDPEWKEYLPRFHSVDVAMLAGVFIVLTALPTMVAPNVQSMATLAEAPPAASGDAVSAPAVAEWADQLRESPARNDLLEESRTELDAVREGAAGPGQLDINRAVVEAIEADTAERELWRLADVDASQAAKQEFEWLQPLVELEFDTTGLLLLFVVLGMNAAILGGLLQAAARRIEPIGAIGRKVVPGGPNSLGVLRFPVLASFLVGVVLMLPFSRAVQAAAESSLVAMYGLQAAPRGLDTALPAIGFALVVVALVVHAIGVVRDRR